MWKKKTTIFFTLFVSYAAYSAWVYTKGTDQHIPSSFTKQEQLGKELWQQKNCSACHQLYGLGGYLGPDLTNITSDSKRGKAYAAVFIKYGGATMPNFHLSDKETEAIVAYLANVDASVKNNTP